MADVTEAESRRQHQLERRQQRESRQLETSQQREERLLRRRVREPGVLMNLQNRETFD